MKRIRIGVIGAGNWGRNHIRTLAALPEAELVAVCDINEDRLAIVHRQYPAVKVVTSAQPLFEMSDGVVIATPAATHAMIAREAIERGVAALVEKPFALTTQDAEATVALAEVKGVPLLVGHLLLFHPAIERLKTLITTRDLGDVFYLYSQRVNLGQVRPDENALWSFGPHDVSVAMELLGTTPVRVHAQGKSYLQPGIEDVVFMSMEFPSGAMAHMQMSWLDPHKERRLTVVGSKKMAVFDDMQPREKLTIYDRGVNRPPEYGSFGESLSIREGDISIPRIPNVEPLGAELRHFVGVVSGQEVPRVSGPSGVAVVRVLEAASESLAAGGVNVPVSSEQMA